jgi:hypothetical protein
VRETGDIGGEQQTDAVEAGDTQQKDLGDGEPEECPT